MIDNDAPRDSFHALRVEQPNGAPKDSVALNVISGNAHDSAVWITGEGLVRGVVKVAHKKPRSLRRGVPPRGVDADASASALSIDVRGDDFQREAENPIVNDSTRAMGIFITTTRGKSSGAMIKVRNALNGPVTFREDFLVDGQGNVATGIPQGAVAGARLHVQAHPGSKADLARFANEHGHTVASISPTGTLELLGSRPPTLNVEVFAGTGASAAVTGTDNRGVITINYGADAKAKGTWITATLGTRFHSPPVVVISPHGNRRAK